MKILNPLLLLDKMDWATLSILAIMLAIVPFSPQPHLIEKLKMLLEGTLTRPIDIFDLVMHSTPILLLVLKGMRQIKKRKMQQ